MKVLVIGAAGGIGRCVVTQALEAGHFVTALLRDPAKLPLEHPHLTLLRGDVLDAAAARDAIGAHDVVVSTIGTRSLKPTTLYSQGTRNIIAAMESAGLQRFVGISASGLHIDRNDPPLLRYVGKPLVARILRESYADLTRMETLLEASALDWTLVVPPRLTDGPKTGTYRTATGENVPHGGMSIARADCADYIVSHLDAGAPARALVFIAH